MADPNISVKISDLPGSGAMADTDVLPLARAGANYKVTGAQIKTYAATPAPAGSDTQVQFNDGGVLGADAGMTYNKTTGTLTVAQLSGNTANGYNPGDFKIIAQSTAPSGFLKCNGAAISRTTYAALFAVIGTMFGAGDGSTTFNLPDLRGEFVRGWDDGRGVDGARSLGSLQMDQTQGHWHKVHGRSGFTISNGGYVIAIDTGGGSSADANSSYVYAGTIISDGVNGTPRTGSETRARNVALLFCIKY